MKRRVLSLMIALALCLNLCPTWALAVDGEPDGGLCPHHPAHTEECGYAPSALEQECTHSHDDGCYTTQTDCIHEHTAGCYPDGDAGANEPVLCTHVCAEDSGCVTRTLSCPHEHDGTCGYVPGNPGAPCTFVCRVCPINELIGKLPGSVTAYNSEQVQARISEIFDLYDELSDSEQQQVDLSPCVSLLDQLEGMGAAALSEDSEQGQTYVLPSDLSFDSPYEVVTRLTINTKEYTLLGKGSSAVQVTADGTLYLKGTVVGQKGVGVEVLSGGSLHITDPATSVKALTYALDIADGAKDICLSAGTYVASREAAIRTADGDFARLLAPGCAYFDADGNPLLPEDLKTAKSVVVGQCADHSNKIYTHIAGTATHTWVCRACGTTGTEPCTFAFDQNGKGTCGLCGNEITVTVDRESLKEFAYDGSVQPENGAVTVTVKDGALLTQGVDYTVSYSTRADVGSANVTVTVTVAVGDNNGTFIKDYTFTQADLTKPVLEWNTTNDVSVQYDGSPVTKEELPGVTINITTSPGVDLHQYLQYSYRAQGDNAYTDGLPTNAGTYDVVVSLPEKPLDVPGYQAASSKPITLIIEKINPIVTAPAAIQPAPEFNRTAQALVTAGTLHSAAARDGVEIKFADRENGNYSADIPTGINAGNYTVWYRTEETENFNAVGPLEIVGVEIQRKTITPIVTLSDYTYLYDGGEKEPKVTVKDEDDVTVLLDTEYEVKYVNNRNVSTDGNPAKVVVSDKAGGNYAITEVEVAFKITLREQETLSITEKPDTVTYGDEFTLSTLGGSGNGNITWEVVADSANNGSATVNRTSGLVRITGAGTITVKATKSGVDPVTGIRNYDDAVAIWTFEAKKKAVVATVTADDKDYDGLIVAKVHAAVEQGVLPGDKIEITGLTGTFDDANAGANKTVTVDKSKAAIDGVNYQQYDISYSSLTVTATIRKAIVHITQDPIPATLTYDGNPQELIDTGAVVGTTGVAVEYALSEDGPYSTDFPKATNAGAYTVWYRVKETPNYTGLEPESVSATIAKKPVIPAITLSGDGLQTDPAATPADFYIYDGNPKTPDVTLTETDGTIPDGEYTVAYSGNTNVGIATVTVTARADGNYDFGTNPVTENFEIKKKQAEVVTAPKPAGTPLTYNTWAQELVTEGEGYGGTMVYALEAADGTKTYSETIPAEINAGKYTVHYKVKGDDNHSDSVEDHVDVTIAPKTVKDPTIELFDENGDPLVSYTYNGQAKKPTVVVKDGSTVIGTTDSTTGENDEYNVVYTDNIDAGKATVSITDKLNGNYTVTGSTTFVILKADIVFAPDPSAANITYDGKAHELLVPGTTSGGEVLYALNSATSTYSAAIPTATEAGNYVVYYKVIGDKNHNDLNDIDNQKVAVTIKRKPLTGVTIKLTPERFEYDGNVKLPEVTVMDGKTVLPEEEYTWTCDVDSPTDAGTYTITIADANGGNYDLSQITAPGNEATFTVGKIPQEELVIGGKPSVTNYGDSFKLDVSGGSGDGAVSWKAEGAASFDSEGNVEITGVGEVTITVEKAADDNYLAARAQWSFTAAPKPVTASIVVSSKVYDGKTTAVVSSASITAINGDAVTIDTDSIIASFDSPDVGTGKTVTLDSSKVQVSGDSVFKYAISYPDTVTADITKATATVTTQPKEITPLTYNGQPQALVTAGKTNVGFIVYSLEESGTYSPEIPTGTDAGTYTVYYKVDATDNYDSAAVSPASVSVNIARKTVTATVELSESSYVYDGAKHEPKITVKDGRTVIDEDQYTVVWKDDSDAAATDVLTNVGTYTATVEGETSGNYNFTATAKVTITAAVQDALKITGKPEHVYYGDTVTTLDTTGGSGNGTVKWSITDGGTTSSINQTTGALTVKDTGTIEVTAERVVPNYGTVSDTWTFTVEPKPVVAEVTIAPKDYDGTTAVAAGAITAEVKASDLVNGETITISRLTGTYDNANAGTGKTVTLNAAQATTTADTDKYTVSYPATVKADITPREVTVEVELSGNDLQTDNTATPPTYSYEYDGTEKTPSVTVNGTDTGGYNATLAASDYTVSYADNKNFGTATVTVTSAEGGNYTFAEAEVHFTIEKAAAQLTSSPQAKDLTYTGKAQELVTVGTASGGHIEYTLDKDDEDSYSEDIPTETKAGTYIVYYKVVGDDNHEGSAASGQVSVTIKPKEITPAITLDQNTFTYNGNEHKPAVTVEDDGTTIGTGEYSVTYRDNINAGTATVIVSDANGGNYIVNGTATFTIEKAAPVVTTAPQGKPSLQYNGELQELVTAGVSGDGTVVYSVDGGNYSAAIPTASAVKTYTIEWKVLGDANHSDKAPATLTVDIDKNTVTSPTISLSADTFKYNGSQQKPVITVYDDNNRVIPEHEYTVKIEGTNGNIGMVDVDTYTVTITEASNSNYVIQNNNTRTFKIVRADQETISITGTQAQVRYGDEIQLGTTGGTGSGSITWTVTDANGDPAKSTISTTGLLTVKDVGGPITVTATRSAGGNYSDVSATWEFSAGQKQVTAVVTAADRPYDAGNKSATVTATVPNSELVSGDSITIIGLTGAFDDDSVGTNKRVNVTSTSANVTGNNSGNYDIIYPATTTASILAVAATVDTDPGIRTLTYDASQAQELVTAGTVTGGAMVYSLDGTNFTPVIPKAKDAGTYTVYFKAQGDGNHTDSEVDSVQVTIDKQTVATPQIELSPPSAKYDGNVKRPEVTVLDSANNVIPASEYKVTYVSDNGENWTDQGTYTVKIENISGGNYVVNTDTKNFIISTTAQSPLEIVNKPGLVYYGDTFTLSATGGSGNGAVTWESSDENIAYVDTNNGSVTIKGTGAATITATRSGGANYDDATATYSFNALKKPITAIVTAEDRVYASGDTNATIHITWKDGDLVSGDSIDILSISGTFEDEYVGTNKTVTISVTLNNNSTAQKYDITIPGTTTASILKADAEAPTLTANNRTYDGTSQDLVTGGDGNTLYSDARDGVYSTTVPTGTNAGTYTVWYKEKGDANYNDSEPQAMTVTISRKTLSVSDTNATLSGSDLQTDDDGNYYEYDGTEKTPSVIIKDGAATVPASEYTVSYSGNKNVGTATVTITNAEGGNYDVSGSVSFEIREGSAQLTSSPQAKDLTYTGEEQELVTVGTASGGHIEYTLDNTKPTSYSEDIPTGIVAGTYTVYYKVVGDSNHADSTTVGSVTVTIKPKEIVSPKITVFGSYTYDGTAKEPGKANVKVEDGDETIANTEYDVTYRDNVDAGTATVIITNANGGNYIVNGTGTFTIAKANVTDITAPEGLENLPYNGAAQALVKAGSASGGTMVYSLDEDGEYSPAIPTATAVGDYEIWYMVQGDDNHNDSEPDSVDASIIQNNVASPTVQVMPETVTYNGKKQEPTVTVMDGGNVIDGSEYTVEYKKADGSVATDLTDAGTYTLTIASKGTNYSFNTTATFTILTADQTPLTITGTRERVYYGDTIQLGTTGGNGTVTWTVESDDPAIATINNGRLEITGVGSVKVTATSKADGYADQTATWSFYAEKKPVTAVVTAAAKTYDGETDATVTATLQSSDLVNGDVITIKLSGSFEDPDAGTDKKVNVDSTNPDFDGSTDNFGNYNITYPATTTASILKADIDETQVTAPAAAENLVYTGNPQYLVTAGSSREGTMEYSLDGLTYSASLPTGANAGDYEIWYRVKGDSNHNDTDGTQLDDPVTIAKQKVDDPTIEFTPNSVSYDGAVHKPSVTVKDNNGRVIPDSEYTVTYDPDADWKTAGEHKVTITGKTDGNYDITTKTADFTILPMGQNPLSIVNQPGMVQYGDTFTLSTVGGSGTGAVTWESDKKDIATIDAQSGLVKVLKSGGPVKITATKAADDNYGAVTVTWTFSAEKRSATAVVTAKDREYDVGNKSADLVITWQAGDLLKGDTIDLDSVLTGAFDDANAGTNKIVRITGTLSDSDKYDVSWNATTTASITPKTASVSGVTAQTDLKYNRNAQSLVNEGTVTGDGTLVYSLDGVSYTPSVPTGTAAGTYTVWYKAEADNSGNYKDSTPGRVVVTIAPKQVDDPVITLSPDEFVYDGSAKKPDVEVKDGSIVIPASEYTVSYSNNVQAGTATVTVSNADGGNYNITQKTVNFTIKAGTAGLTREPQANNLTYNGFAQSLVTAGTAVNGSVVYSTSEDGNYTASIPKETNAGTYQVWYKVEGSNGAADTEPDCVIVVIQPKPVTPVVTLASDSLQYTGNPVKPAVTVVVDGNTLTENTDYTVTYSNNTNAGTATVVIQSVSGRNCNYQFDITRTFEIVKAKATFAVEPEGLTDLVYTGEAQELIEKYTGLSTEGIVVYSRDTVSYSADIPTGTTVGKYTYFAKVLGNSTHEDSDIVTIKAEIKQNVVANPRVELDGSSFSYTGNEIKPSVTVYDDDHNVIIPATEYTVRYANNVNVGDNATVTVTSKGSNYSFTASTTFEIIGADQIPLAITGKQDAVYYGDTLTLGVTGGSGSSAVTWESSDETIATVSNSGVVSIKKAGTVTITATQAASGGYKAVSDTWTFSAKPKPVTPIVTAASRAYDGTMNVALTVTVSSGLISGDSIPADGVTATGQFTDANVGTGKTVVITTWIVSDAVSEKYDIINPGTTTASITQKAASVTDAPKEVENLKYTGDPQALVSGGNVDGGNLAYSLDGVNYSFNVPTGTDAKTYTVWYKVIANNDNYKDSAVASQTVAIAQNTDKPSVLCMPDTIQYDGTAKTPTIRVLDSENRTIPESEYTVKFNEDDRIAVKVYTVTVADKSGGNYEFDSPVTGTFKIVEASQNPLSIVTDIPTEVYYGDTFRLSAMGGSGSGAIKWNIDGTAAEITQDGVVTVEGTGAFTVKAYREAADGYSQSNTVSVPFHANPKPVTPVVTAADKSYDGTTNATLRAAFKAGDLVGNDIIELHVGTGEFASEDVGTNKLVTITGCSATGADVGKYAITWPESTTASINKVDAKIATKPTATNPTYDGNPKDLVNPGSTKDGIGTIEYSMSQNGEYSEDIPTATNADTYTVWYRVADSVNYTGVAAASIEVVIEKAEPRIDTKPTAAGTEGQTLNEIGFSNGGAASVEGKFVWKNGSIKPDVGTSQQDAIFTPNDTANYKEVTIEVTVTITALSGGSGTAAMPDTSTPTVTSGGPSTVQTTVQNGTASTVVSAAAGSKLVKEAAANQSESIVIKPEIASDVTKTEVSIPASTVSQITSETNAALTISAPIADVTIPQTALNTLSRAGGTVNVVTEQVEQAVVLTLTAGGETVESVPGGLTLTVPAEDAGPGTVAMLVNEDGTREPLRKVVVEDGKLNIPLDGSATVEIVDNSKDFADVPSTSWAADAVAFASAHELFNGTSETTFSPDQAMSRGMLAAVLYSLEGRPEQELTGEFSDVGSDAWYAESIAWATENGIANGYGDGQFGPNDSITREQFAVMLWKYAGSPAASGQGLDFTDADQASSYALEALCWAAENGILSGYGDGRLVPGGTTTRAQAAQMLKNFLENT